MTKSVWQQTAERIAAKKAAAMRLSWLLAMTVVELREKGVVIGVDVGVDQDDALVVLRELEDGTYEQVDVFL